MEILSKTKRNLWLVAGICFWILGAIVFGKYDLEISQLLYHPDWKWAVAFENGGRLTTPILLAVGLHFLIYLEKRKHPKKIYWVVDVGIMAIVVVLILLFSGGLSGLVQELLLTAIYLAFYLLIQLGGKQLDEDKLIQIKRIVWTMFVATALIFLVITVVKVFAGRLRFRDMEDISQFVPWYQWHPFSGNHSFPSGHTGNSMAVIGVLLLSGLIQTGWKRILVAALPIVYLLLMAISRIIMGAHYASDVLFSLGIIAYGWYIAIWLCQRYQKRKIDGN